MRIWNTKGLAKDFAEGKVSSKDRIVYLFLTVSFWYVLDNLPAMSGSQVLQREKTLLAPALGISSLVVGFLWCYTKNRKVDDREFIDRFVAFGLLDGFRAVIFALCYGWAIAGLALVVGNIGRAWGLHPHLAQSPMGQDAEEFLLVLPVTILWFVLIRRDIGRVGGPKL
jgi:hypothetical protein